MPAADQRAIDEAAEIQPATPRPMAEYQPTWRRPIANLFRGTATDAVSWCLRGNISPNTISYLSMLAAGGAAICFWQAAAQPWLLIPAVLLCYLRLWCNMLDGMVALAAGKAGRSGEIANELPDRVSDVLIFVGVAHSGLCHPISGYWAAIFSLLVAYVGTLGQAVGAQREFSGLMTKPWRMVALHIGAWITLALFYTERGNRPFAGLTILDWTHVVIIAGCVQTIFIRLVRILRTLQVQDREPSRVVPAPEIEPEKVMATMGDKTRHAAVLNERPSANVARLASECSFKSWDGTELFYRAWLPSGSIEHAVVLFHRGHEHSGRWQETVDTLNLPDVAFFAWDARGHGRSPGERGAAPNLAAVIKDVDCFLRHLVDRYGIRTHDTIVLAHSLVAVAATAWIHDYAPPVRALILATPAFCVRLYVPFAVPLLRIKQKLLGPGWVKSYVRSSMLTHDEEQARLYDADPLIFKQIAVNVLLDLHDTAKRLVQDAGAMTVPTLVLSTARDWVVDLAAQREFFDRLSSSTKRMEVLGGFSHALFHEHERHVVVDKVRQFIEERFSRPPENRSLIEDDRYGYTRHEFDRLRTPGGMRFGIVRNVLQTFGKLSRGIALGWRCGFDSGLTLDYVYENRPQGTTPLGRLIDWFYLNSIGWRGIRLRRQHLEKLLREVIERTHAAGRPVHILDIASGPGRYLLQSLHDLSHIPSTAILRDYKEENLAAARQLAGELGLTNITTVHGDAFDRASLADTMPRPTVAIVSGLFELFPENEPVLRSLRGLADAIEPGGHLIYTNQPWHPQVEFIARVLINREGQPWIMRRRTQAEMDELVQAAGFEKVAQEIDPWGIFTVSVARRLER